MALEPKPTKQELREVIVATEENPLLNGLKSVTVHANPLKNLEGAAYYDPLQKVTIRAEPVTLKRTKFVQQKLANEEIVETEE